LNLEAAFQTMWERNAAGLPPAAFAVPRIATAPGAAPGAVP
jgi:hypothetical protein